MNALSLLPAVLPSALPHTSNAEAAVFWLLAPVAVLAALGVVLSRNAVHAALLLVVDFFCLAVFYALQDAIFLAAVQVIVYTGAIMVLFLFVLMLVGVDSADSLVETLRGQRAAALLAGAAFLALLVAAIEAGTHDVGNAGLLAANANGNVQGIARLLFSSYVLPFELTSALLIVAALGVMVLGHRERTEPPKTQKQLMRERFGTAQVSPLPPPGVFARRDSADTAALLPDGSPAPSSRMPEYAAVPFGAAELEAAEGPREADA